MSDPAEFDLTTQVEALDALLAELPPSLDVEEPRLKGAISDRMGDIMLLPGGAAFLVARLGADERVAVARPLAFQLAVVVNDRQRAIALAPVVFSLIELLATADPWPRLNLCTAAQRLLMFGAPLPSGGQSASVALARMLHEALGGPPAVRATAATVVTDLFYGGHTGVLAETSLAELRAQVLGFADAPDELTRKEAQGLSEFLRQSEPAG